MRGVQPKAVARSCHRGAQAEAGGDLGLPVAGAHGVQGGAPAAAPALHFGIAVERRIAAVTLLAQALGAVAVAALFGTVARAPLVARPVIGHGSGDCRGLGFLEVIQVPELAPSRLGLGLEGLGELLSGVEGPAPELVPGPSAQDVVEGIVALAGVYKSQLREGPVNRGPAVAASGWAGAHLDGRPRRRPGERLGHLAEVGLAGEVALGQGVGQLLQGFAPEDDVGVLADQLATGGALGVAPLGLRPGGGVAVPEVQAARGEGWQTAQGM